MKRFCLFSILACLSLVNGWAQDEPFRNPELSPAERAEDLLGRLTLT